MNFRIEIEIRIETLSKGELRNGKPKQKRKGESNGKTSWN
jgi:hypothetical protein